MPVNLLNDFFKLSIGEEEKQVVDNLESSKINTDNLKKIITLFFPTR